MVALNIIRNKIVSRIFATVKRGTPYVELGKFVWEDLMLFLVVQKDI